MIVALARKLLIALWRLVTSAREQQVGKFTLDKESPIQGFRMPGWWDYPRAPAAGVRKAPRHEIAGCVASAGRLRLGDAELHLPEHGGVKDADVVAYVRPHEIKVRAQSHGTSVIPATIKHVNSAGPLVRLELERTDDGTRLTVDLTKEESSQISLQPGGQIFVELKNVRVFTADHSSAPSAEAFPTVSSCSVRSES
jgi:hypothetical protein